MRWSVVQAVKQAGGVCRILGVVSIPGGKAAEENGVGLIETLLKRKGQSFLETAVAVIMPAVWWWTCWEDTPLGCAEWEPQRRTRRKERSFTVWVEKNREVKKQRWYGAGAKSGIQRVYSMW